MLLLFIVGLPIIIVSFIFLVINAKKIKAKIKYNKIVFGAAVFGIIIGSCFISLPISFFVFMRAINSSAGFKNVNTGITITWKTKEDYSGNYFILDNKRYEILDIKNTQNSESIEIDRAIANIVPDNYQEMKWFFWLLGADSKQTLYSLKNINDYSILTTGGDSSLYLQLYCDIEYKEDKEMYYSNLENYTFYFSLDKFGDEKSSQPIQNTSLSVIESLYNYKGIETNIDEGEYKYITIFGISGDRIIHKYIITAIIDGDTFYREEYSTYDKIHVSIIEGEQKAFLLGLLAGAW
jgi:hypothetical protein